MMAWSLSQEDCLDLREKFLALDADNTGTISRCQFITALRENCHVNSIEAERLFAILDTDRDDEVCYSEFLAAVLQDSTVMQERVLRKTFARFDQKKAGTITVEDLRKVLGKTFESVDVSDLMREADVDGNGSICYEEFCDYFQHHALDTPSDSAIGVVGHTNADGKKKKHRDSVDELTVKITPKKDAHAKRSPWPTKAEPKYTSLMLAALNTAREAGNLPK
jgi:Ca2+-binding EF-hand superfamily protein